MTYGATTKQALPYPMADEKLADGNDAVRKLAQALDGKVVMVFASQSAMNTAVPTPSEGMLAYIADSNLLQLRVDSAWVNVFPTSPAIYSGTAAPASTLGTTGDIYVQY